MVERYPNLEEEGDGSIPGWKISSVVDINLPGGQMPLVLWRWHVGLLFLQKREKKRKSNESKAWHIISCLEWCHPYLGFRVFQVGSSQPNHFLLARTPTNKQTKQDKRLGRRRKKKKKQQQKALEASPSFLFIPYILFLFTLLFSHIVTRERARVSSCSPFLPPFCTTNHSFSRLFQSQDRKPSIQTRFWAVLWFASEIREVFWSVCWILASAFERSEDIMYRAAAALASRVRWFLWDFYTLALVLWSSFGSEIGSDAIGKMHLYEVELRCLTPW